LASYTYYDSLGRPIQTQQPANTGSSSPTVTGFSYNAGNSLTQVTDPRSLNTTYTPTGWVSLRPKPARTREAANTPMTSTAMY